MISLTFSKSVKISSLLFSHLALVILTSKHVISFLLMSVYLISLLKRLFTTVNSIVLLLYMVVMTVAKISDMVVKSILFVFIVATPTIYWSDARRSMSVLLCYLLPPCDSSPSFCQRHYFCF